MTRIFPFVTVAWSQNVTVNESFSSLLQIQMEITQKDGTVSELRLQQEEANANAEVGRDCSLSTAEEESKALLIRIKMIYST